MDSANRSTSQISAKQQTSDVMIETWAPVDDVIVTPAADDVTAEGSRAGSKLLVAEEAGSKGSKVSAGSASVAHGTGTSCLD